GAEAELPPFAPVARIDRRRPEDKRPRFEHMRQRAWVALGRGRYLGKGHMAGRLDEVAELAVGDRCRVDPEAVDDDAMHGTLLGIVSIRAHAKRAAGNEDHAASDRRLSKCPGALCHRRPQFYRRTMHSRWRMNAVNGLARSRAGDCAIRPNSPVKIQ